MMYWTHFHFDIFQTFLLGLSITSRTFKSFCKQEKQQVFSELLCERTKFFESFSLVHHYMRKLHGYRHNVGYSV